MYYSYEAGLKCREIDYKNKTKAMIELRETGIDEILKVLADLPPQLSVAVQKTTLEIAENVALELYIYPGPLLDSEWRRGCPKGGRGGGWVSRQGGRRWGWW